MEMETQTTNTVSAVKIDKDIKNMLEAGVHFGHKKTRQHPKMSKYVFGVRNSVSIIDLEKTKELLQSAVKYIRDAVKEGKTVLFVDTKPSTREETKEAAGALDMPYVSERWSGGTLTNWKTIQSRIEYLQNLEAKTKSEEWSKYTKKERNDMKEEIDRLNVLWGGIKNMSKLPDIVFIVDITENDLAAREASARSIPVVAIIDTNADPTRVKYPIPANDDALSSVKYVLAQLRDGTIKNKPRTSKGAGTAEISGKK